MSQSILDSVKKVLGIPTDYHQFDPDIIMHINSAFGTLLQLGIGPSYGFSIEDSDTTWDDFLLGDARLNPVKTYMCLKVRLAFDPPATSFHIAAMEKQIEEATFRINLVYEMDTHGSPLNGYSPTGGSLDGGSPFDNSNPNSNVFDGGSP